MKKLALMVLVVSIGWALTACSHPSSGQVRSKEYVPPSSWIQMVCTAYNNKGICVSYMPITHHVPECWELHLVTETDKWEVCVSKEEWDRLQPEMTWKEAA